MIEILEVSVILLMVFGALGVMGAFTYYIVYEAFFPLKEAPLKVPAVGMVLFTTSWGLVLIIVVVLGLLGYDFQ